MRDEGKLDAGGALVQENAVYRARVKGHAGWRLVQAIAALDGGLAFWVEHIGYAVSPSDIDIISPRVLPPIPPVPPVPPQLK